MWRSDGPLMFMLFIRWLSFSYRSSCILLGRPNLGGSRDGPICPIEFKFVQDRQNSVYRSSLLDGSTKGPKKKS